MLFKTHAALEIDVLDEAVAAPCPDVETDVLSLFDECGHRLLRYVGSFGLSSDVAEDIVQDVFLALFRHLQRGRPRQNLRGWVFRVAHNLALRHRRGVKRRGPEAEWNQVLMANLVDPADDPEHRLAQGQQQRNLHAILKTLSVRDQRCVRLRAEGLRYREIARVLGLSLGTVANSLARALDRLQRGGEC